MSISRSQRLMYVAHTCIHNATIQQDTVNQCVYELDFNSYISDTKYTTISLNCIKNTFCCG
jgi:hypothetical protein